MCSCCINISETFGNFLAEPSSRLVYINSCSNLATLVFGSCHIILSSIFNKLPTVRNLDKKKKNCIQVYGSCIFTSKSK